MGGEAEGGFRTQEGRVGTTAARPVFGLSRDSASSEEKRSLETRVGPVISDAFPG